jgi:hypothetical protein
LLSNCTTAEPADSAIPLLLAGFAIQPCTIAVTSTATKSPAPLTWKTPAVLPTAGSVAYVTLYSPHALATGAKLTAPAVVTRFAYSRNTARETCDAVVPAGSSDRSNCSSAV